MSLNADAHQILEEAQREEWLTVKEYAAMKRLHPQTVYSAIRRGRFRHQCERAATGAIRIFVPRESINTLKSA